MRILALILLASPVSAEDWQIMNGEQIRAALSGHVLSYGTARQDFRASGKTLYEAGESSWGHWAVRGDQYCSTWPPSDLWACYDMARRGQVLRFIDENGGTTDGRYAD